MTSIMFVAWLSCISVTVDPPYFIEEIDRISFDAALKMYEVNL
jgi:hypothetical protein